MDAKPGLNKMMLDMLERRCQGDPTKYGCVSLMLDAMSIKKHVQYNPHTESMSGFVDMGDGNNENDVASEALVFMVVGLQGHWKAPIAYFLTRSLSPEPQGVLLSQALEELHAFGGLVENALVYIAGFVVRQILRKLSFAVCRWSLVRDAVPSSFDKNFHLLTLKNNGGLVIPSLGTVKV